jgi:hypothetical protein
MHNLPLHSLFLASARFSLSAFAVAFTTYHRELCEGNVEYIRERRRVTKLTQELLKKKIEERPGDQLSMITPGSKSPHLSPFGSPGFGLSPVGSPRVGLSPVGSPRVGRSPAGSPRVGRSPVGSPRVGRRPVGSPRVGTPIPGELTSSKTLDVPLPQ